MFDAVRRSTGNGIFRKPYRIIGGKLSFEGMPRLQKSGLDVIAHDVFEQFWCSQKA